MQNTTNYSLPYPEGSDTVNLLTVLPALAQLVDAQMKVNANTGIQRGTHSKSGTVNSITVSTDLATGTFFTFVASDDFVEGDSFTFNGEVIAARTPQGTALKTGAFTINQNVLCCNYNGILTIYTNQSAVAVDTQLDDDSQNAIANAAVTAAVNAINAAIGSADISSIGANVKAAIVNLNNAISSANSAIAANTSALGNVKFRISGGKAQHSIDGGQSWSNFSGGEAPLLWSNPNSTAAFAAQNINESSDGWVNGQSLADYEYVLIECMYGTGSTQTNKGITLCSKNATTLVSAPFSNTTADNINKRLATVNNSGITFGNGISNANATQNSSAIPTKIFGCTGMGDVPIIYDDCDIVNENFFSNTSHFAFYNHITNQYISEALGSGTYIKETELYTFTHNGSTGYFTVTANKECQAMMLENSIPVWVRYSSGDKIIDNRSRTLGSFMLLVKEA